jgi:hypothetical protein
MKTIYLSLIGIVCLTLCSVANAASPTCMTRADGETFCKGDRVEFQKLIGVIDEFGFDDDGVTPMAGLTLTGEGGFQGTEFTVGSGYTVYVAHLSHLIEAPFQCLKGVCVGFNALQIYNQAPKLRFGQVQFISKSGVVYVTPVDHDCCTPQALTAWSIQNVAGEIVCADSICQGDWVRSVRYPTLMGGVLGLFQQQIPGADVYAFVRTGSDMTNSCATSLVYRLFEIQFVRH